MTTHFLSKITDHRYKVVTDTGVSQHNLCEIAQYEPINKWYLVKERKWLTI